MDDYISDKAKADAEMDAIERAEAAELRGSRQVWEQLPGESPKAFHAFRLYRDLMEKRTLAKVAETLGCSSTNVERWARRWAWTQRTYEFDLIEEEKLNQQMSRERMAHRRQQVQLGTVLTNIGAHSLRELQIKIEQQLPLNLAPSELAALLKLGDDLKVRGLGTDRAGGKYTRINVIIGTAPDIDDASAESRPALSDDTTGDGFELEPKPN
jgi:hypothetical protein